MWFLPSHTPNSNITMVLQWSPTRTKRKDFLTTMTKTKKKLVTMKLNKVVLVCNLNELFQMLPIPLLKMATWWNPTWMHQTTSWKMSLQSVGGRACVGVSSGTSTGHMLWWMASGNAFQIPVDLDTSPEGGIVHAWQSGKSAWNERCKRHLHPSKIGRTIERNGRPSLGFRREGLTAKKDHETSYPDLWVQESAELDLG